MRQPRLCTPLLRYGQSDATSLGDAGGKTQPEEEPLKDAIRHSYRVLDLIDNQVRALRKRQLIDSFKAKRDGCASSQAHLLGYPHRHQPV